MSGTPVSSWEKFKLLLWKNLLLQWSSRWSVILETFLPLLYVLLLVGLRFLTDYYLKETTNFDEIDLSSTDFKWRTNGTLKILYYSPKNPIFEAIVKAAAVNLNLESIEAFQNAGALESALIANVNVLGGIQFDDAMRNISDYPSKLSFAIRQNAFESTWLQQRLFRVIDLVRSPVFRFQNYDDDDFQGAGYIQKGFIAIQHAVSAAYLKLASDYKEELPEIFLQRFPYPPFVSDELMMGLFDLLPLIAMLSFAYPAGVLVKNITVEKERQLKEIMKMMGLQNWIHWAAWFMRAFIPWGITAVIICVILKIPLDEGVRILNYSSWSILLCFLLLYIAVSICYCFMFAIFFNKPSTAAAVGSFVWFVQYAPYLLYRTDVISTAQGAKWLCLLPNSALGIGLNTILKFEVMGEGMHWNHITTPLTADEDALSTYMGIMAISGVIFLTICLYIEQIFPGEYGVPKKWYFLFTKSHWCGEQDFGIKTEHSMLNSSQQNATNFELAATSKIAGLKVKDLKKKFGSKLAVKNLTFNLYEDEITVLLGHNGAGKTTTISMLCGMFPPTSGTAIVNGYNIVTNTEEARSSLGICPQHNVLFDEMSVENHIVFYSRLKGICDEAAIQSEVKHYLEILGLQQKAEEKAKNLSGGMKRKLSMCCAFCGNTKVVLCDEPSSGMDPASRRQLWDLLQAEKIGRTILLTTHFMDEADVLGDRIAIMCGGELKCYGSPFFLKKKYGTGYKLICVKRPNCDINQITALLQRYIPQMKPASDIGAELTYLLPEEYISKFEEMLAGLEQKSDELNLSGYGIGISSMEEVFMKVGAENFENVPSTAYGGIVDGNTIGRAETGQAYDLFSGGVNLQKGFSLFISRLLAMFLKKSLLTWRNKFAFFAQLLICIGLLVLVLKEPSTDNNASDKKTIQIKPMKLDLRIYPEETTVLEFQTEFMNNAFMQNVTTSYKSMIRQYGEPYRLETTGRGQSFEDYIIELGRDKQFEINRNYLTAASVRENEITAWFNYQAYHSAPLSVNLIYNALGRSLLGPGTKIIVKNAPLPLTIATEDIQWDSNDRGYFVNVVLCFLMCFVTSFYVGPVIKERISRAKLLQLVSGAGIWLYWLTQFLYDLIIFTIIISASVVTIACFQTDGFSTLKELGALFGFLLAFGYAALPFAYLITLFTHQPATGFSRAFVINTFSGLALYLVYKIQYGSLYSKLLLKVFRIFPHFTLAIGLEQLYINTGEFCKGFEDVVELRCETSRSCCQTIYPELLYFSATGFYFLLFVILCEYRFVAELIQKLRNVFYSIERPGVIITDTTETTERVPLKKISKDELATHNLVVDAVTKYYGTFMAVEQVQFVVDSSECFGLLGVNGAGKTSIFKMLTGEELITFGEIYVKGLSVKSNLNRVYKEIGYCPQFDALLSDLTGRETLRIFCLLRGVPMGKINELIQGLSEAFGFTKHLDKLTTKYSGGNKRKLSTALAVLGSPTVIYLDEPTSGMDPAARRQLWNMVCRIRDAGKSIVLTSHSMEECEALCTRLAIMVNGEFKCIGSTQHLKNQYSKGLILKIKIKRQLSEVDLAGAPQFVNSSMMATERSQIVSVIKDFIELQFPESKLHEEFQDILTFHIPLTDIKWSQIFGIMERNRLQLNIADYSISQTTLEEIFLDLANMQREDKQLRT